MTNEPRRIFTLGTVAIAIIAILVFGVIFKHLYTIIYFAGQIIPLVGLFFLVRYFMRKKPSQNQPTNHAAAPPVVERPMTAEEAYIAQSPVPEYAARMLSEPRIEFGVTTGILLNRQTPNAPIPEMTLYLTEKTAARGLALLGSPGSGKTSAGIWPSLNQSLRNGWGSVVFAMKTSDPYYVRAICAENNVKLYEIGPNLGTANLISWLSPDAAAEAMASCCAQSKEGVWVAAAQELCRAWFLMLKGLGSTVVPLPPHENATDDTPRLLSLDYSLTSLKRCLSLPMEDISAICKTAYLELSTLKANENKTKSDIDTLHMLNDAIEYFTYDFQARYKSSDDEKLYQSVLFSISPVITALCGDHTLRTAFAGEPGVDIAAAIRDGACVMFFCDDSLYPVASIAAMRFHFTRFSEITQRRQIQDGIKPCLMVADELGSFATDKMIPTFSRSRAARIMPVIGIQSISFLAQKLGNVTNANSMMSLFSSWSAFDVKDEMTRQFISLRLGSHNIREEQTSQSSNNGSPIGAVAHAFHPQGGVVAAIGQYANSMSSSTSTSVNTRVEEAANQEILSSLGPIDTTRVTGDFLRLDGVTFDRMANGMPRGFVKALASVDQTSGGSLRDVILLEQYKKSPWLPGPAPEWRGDEFNPVDA